MHSCANYQFLNSNTVYIFSNLLFIELVTNWFDFRRCFIYVALWKESERNKWLTYIDRANTRKFHILLYGRMGNYSWYATRAAIAFVQVATSGHEEEWQEKQRNRLTDQNLVLCWSLAGTKPLGGAWSVVGQFYFFVYNITRSYLL